MEKRIQQTTGEEVPDNETWATMAISYCMHIKHSSIERHHVGATSPLLCSPHWSQGD